MTFSRRAFVLALLLGGCGVAPCLAQSATTTTRPVLTPPEMEDFLLHARIIDTVRTLKGVTGARQVTLSDGRITHDAQVQDGDIYKAIFEVGPKNTEVNFRDSSFRTATATPEI